MRKPIECQLKLIAATFDAGLLTPDEALGQMIEANCAWAQRFLSAEQVQELERFLWHCANTHPVLLAKMGRVAPVTA